MMKKDLVYRMEKFVNGSSFMTISDYASFMNFSITSAKRKLYGLERVEGKYYFIPDIADMMIRRVEI